MQKFCFGSLQEMARSLYEEKGVRNREASSSEEFAAKIRKLSLCLVHKAKASHIGSALSIADILAVLYFNEDILLMHGPKDPQRDRFILSKGHACVALYSTLYLKGYIAFEELFTYGDDYSPFMNHASHVVPGIEHSTGALGHGLGVASGKALFAKMENKNWHTFVLVSDGELQEGSNWEALLFASHNALNNLTVIVDHNNLQSLTTVEETVSIEPLADKFSAFGWNAISLDGHNHLSLALALKSAKSSNQPTILIAKTTKGKGVSFMENQVLWHYKNPNDLQLNDALNELL